MFIANNTYKTQSSIVPKLIFYVDDATNIQKMTEIIIIS